jgi:hypothetical protein
MPRDVAPMKVWWGLVGTLTIGLGGASRVEAQSSFAPAPPSYTAISRTIDSIRKSPTLTASSEAGGWNAYFDELTKQLDAYAAARTSNDQLAPLNRVYRLSAGLEGLAWEPANELREAIRAWLRPRVRIAWAERRLTEALTGTPTSNEEAEFRKGWSNFVDNKLGQALREFEGAKSVQARQAAIKKLSAALASLKQTNPWTMSAELQAAADDLFNAPNIDVSADVAALYPVLSAQVVADGPIYRKGYVSQVTAGPYAGFGLVPSDQGIAFTNSQYLTSVTPITDFQQQIASDQRGRRAAKLYYFSAESVDGGLLTVTALLTPFGVQLMPNSGHNTDALIGSAPQPGKGFPRFIASLIGMNQNKITQKVYEGAIGRIRENVVREAAEESAERSAVAQQEQNSKLAKVFRGDGAATIDDVTIAGLSLRSRTENALIGGTVKWAGTDQTGADLPQPPKFAAPAAGISADIHFASVANNVVTGYLESPKTADVRNLMIVTKKVEPGTKPADALNRKTNVDFPEYIKAVDAARSANDPTTQAIRIRKPKQAPEFGVDARGFLVVVAHDLELDVPVPAQVANSRLGGAAAKVYRLQAKVAEFVFEIKPVTDPDGKVRLTGNLKEFTPEPGSRVLAINDDESKALPLDPFRSVFIFQGFAQAIRSKPLNLPLENIKLKGYRITSISDLDPTGWMRIVLTPTGERPLAPSQ